MNEEKEVEKDVEEFDFVNNPKFAFLDLMRGHWLQWIWKAIIMGLAIYGFLCLNRIMRGELVEFDFQGVCPHCGYEQLIK
jgi:hypothetical protein